MVPPVDGDWAGNTVDEVGVGVFELAALPFRFLALVDEAVGDVGDGGASELSAAGKGRLSVRDAACFKVEAYNR